MNTDVADLLRTLPSDLDLDADDRAQFAQLLEELTHKAPPTGRLARGWSLGSLQARIAVAYLVSRMRRALAGDHEAERLRNEFHARTALKLLTNMGHLRGLMLKLGQAMANFPKWVPDEFIELLGTLNFQAPPMHFALIREALHAELGGDPEDVFAEFDTQAFAAASLGQVHRARLHTGEDVAVKVQYPGIARSIESDFRNLGLLMAPMKFQRQWRDFQDKLEDVRDTMLAETDYTAEAAWTQRVADVFADDPDIVVPRVFPEHSTQRVLTLDLVPGLHLDDWLATSPSQDERDRMGTLLCRVCFRLFYSARVNLSDPHPGNLLFLPDGRLGVIDFGCMRAFDEAEWDYMWEGTKVLLAGAPDDALDALGIRGCRLDAEEARDEERLAAIRASVRWIWEPLMHEGPFDFGSEDYFQRGLDTVSEVMGARTSRALPLFTWTNRLFYGVRALLFRMGARVDMRGVNLEELRRAGLSDAS